MREKHLQTDFLKVNKVQGFFELKIIKAKSPDKIPSIPFNILRDHQRDALLGVSMGEEGFSYKIADSPVSWAKNEEGQRQRMRFTLKKPFDCFYFKDAGAYVVLCVYFPRMVKRFVYVPILSWLQAKDDMEGKKSIKYDDLFLYAGVWVLDYKEARK